MRLICEKGWDSRHVLELGKFLNLRFPEKSETFISKTLQGEVAGISLLTPEVDGNRSLHVGGFRKYWLCEELLSLTFSAAFLSQTSRRVTATVLASNGKCIKLTENMGFKLEGFLRCYANEGLLIYGMLKEECKWAV